MRLATFNVENLFSRYRFVAGIDPLMAAQEGFTAEDLRHRIADPEAKHLTAELILLLQADVLALQEVEDMSTLRRFRDRYLGGRAAYPHLVVIEGNDSRSINVGVLSRLPIVHVRSWQHLTDPVNGQLLFSRDCLEVDIEVAAGRALTLFVNHFKSMRDDIGDGGRARTRALRQRQCEAVKAIVQQRFGEHAGDHAWVVLGDFNDYLTTDLQGHSGIDALVRWGELHDVAERLPEELRWTHFWRGHAERGLAPAYQQLDYLLLSRSLAARNVALPVVERRGQPGRASRFAGERLDGVGFDRPKASDHCPLAMDLHNI